MASTWESLDNLFGGLVDTAGSLVNVAGASVADRIQRELGAEAPPPTQASRPETQPDAVVQVPQSGPEQAAVTKQAMPSPGAVVNETVKQYLPYVAVGLLVMGFFALRGAR